ncbi:hypothetical protein HXX76_014256 [Chlamydomonas incerta]|uniref:C2 NT-type domain-containing protein n=1 Tax=Chlamydomonas incerta TaxID=51695 RepID=A0A835SQQ7_CHLIN|nr:hypothetical protein HXX76_014256 [Chlamydomonas incerta]|eukprot:KAG2424835.1 hypothetical protein HXX76_014256 [Chlamydomonas incerta]
MLERISSQGSEAVKGKGPKGFQVFGGGTGVKRNHATVAFHVVISELRAELLSCKQLHAGVPCTLLWVRGDTVHVTEDSVGQTVLSWSDTYFSQMVSLQAGAHGYKPKECKFKVQQRAKTIAKTAVVDLSKYCSEVGLAKESQVAIPLQPVGTLYFVVSTAPAADQQGGPPLDTAASQSSLLTDGRPSYSLPSTAAAAGDSGYGAGGAGGGNSQYSALTSKYSGGAAAGAGGPAQHGSGGGDEGDRPSNTRSSAGGGRPVATSKKDAHEDESISSFFRRKKGPGKAPPTLVTPSLPAPGPAPASGGGTPTGTGPLSSTSAKQLLRKTESARASPSAWERNLATDLLGSDATASPASPANASKFSSRRSITSHGLGGASTAATATPQQQQPHLPADGVRRGSGASYHSDVAGGAGAGAASSAAKVGPTGSDAGGGAGGGPGWGAWIRGGMGWGTRSSNHSATGTSTPGAASQASMHGPGGAAGGGEPDSGGLEAAIRSAAEPAELRDLALDLLHERDEWRNRALSAQDALGRAQTARGAAVREAQRFEVRLREYQDELGRRTDGSLLQELVEAKVRIAELANENLRLRRQITHMGPLFYGDSGEDPGTPHKPATHC